MKARILRKTRTEEERHRRHLYGDRGGRFSGFIFRLADDDCTNTITTKEKDNYVAEMEGW